MSSAAKGPILPADPEGSRRSGCSVLAAAALHGVFDLTDPDANVLFDMSLDDARECLRSGDVGRVRQIEGHFALVVREGQRVRAAAGCAGGSGGGSRREHTVAAPDGPR